jgi:DNA-binding HxlR family transcriptional regulator
MKEHQLRSDCPINYPLEIVGDKWSLLIIRDIAIFGKTSYGEFLSSDEKIATNILSNRLSMLEANGIISKKRHATNKTKSIYSLAQPGLDLIPLLIEMLIWSVKQRPIEIGPDALLAEMAVSDRQQLINAIQTHLQAGNEGPFIQTLQ